MGCKGPSAMPGRDPPSRTSAAAAGTWSPGALALPPATRWAGSAGRGGCPGLLASLLRQDALHGRQRDPARLRGDAERGASGPQQDDAGPHGIRHPRPAKAPAFGLGLYQPGPDPVTDQLGLEAGTQAGTQGVRTRVLTRATRNVRGRLGTWVVIGSGGTGSRAVRLTPLPAAPAGSWSRRRRSARFWKPYRESILCRYTGSGSCQPQSAAVFGLPVRRGFSVHLASHADGVAARSRFDLSGVACP
jgi:hypothetical protein